MDRNQSTICLFGKERHGFYNHYQLTNASLKLPGNSHTELTKMHTSCLWVIFNHVKMLESVCNMNNFFSDKLKM